MPNQDHIRDMQRRVTAASGYLDLEMNDAAMDEIEGVAPGLKLCREVLTVRTEICMRAEAWEQVRVISTHLVREWPDDAQHWIWLAYGTRRSKSIGEAKDILLRAVEIHAGEPMIHFNLACYESQLGDMTAAKACLDKAIGLEPGCRLAALDDPDLLPFWDSIGRLSLD